MTNEDKKFIKSWFKSDLNIEIEASISKESITLILESDAYYVDGKRSNGQLREIWCPLGTSEKLYNKIDDLCGIFYTEEELIEALEDIENRGFKLEIQ